MRDGRPFYRRPSSQTWLVVVIGILFFFILLARTGQLFTFRDVLRTVFFTLFLRFERTDPRVWLLVLDVFLFTGALVLGLAFFSQFVLPLKNLEDRRSALARMFAYFTRLHGPAIYVENGKVRERAEEMRRRGPGVVLLDTASGAVIRNDFAFTGTTGPGVYFTNFNEYLASAVDLHVKSVEKGPLGKEDPFKPLDETSDPPETEENFRRRQERRMETSGFTRDGVEVVPNIRVLYRLKRRPKDKSYSFGYYPVSVFQWVTADGQVTPQAADKTWEHVPLEDLPAHIAAEVWREYLQKFTLTELFYVPTLGPEGGETALATISRFVQDRLTKLFVVRLSSTGEPLDPSQKSQEYIKLTERGIKVLRVSITNLRFESRVETRLIQQWVATWLQRAQTERDLVEKKRSFTVLGGRQKALEQFAFVAIQPFRDELLALRNPIDDREEFIQMKLALECLVEGTLAGSRDPRFIQLLQMEEINLRDLLAWIG